jgi:acyl carrier protein phosphodiesterase
VNYLAHILLAGEDSEAQLGGLLGDFTKPNGQVAFGDKIEREIRIHRMVDSFTDSHRVVLSAKAKFRPGTRRFSGIVLDILYDHFLADTWAHYSQVDLRGFIDRFYDSLMNSPFSLPQRLHQIAPVLVEEDWLGSYVEYAGFERAVRRLSGRLSKGAGELIGGLEDASRNLSEFRDGFGVFFPELQKYVTTQRHALMELEV